MNQQIFDLQLALSSMENKHRLLKECFRQDIARQAKERTARRIEREKLEGQVSDLKYRLKLTTNLLTYEYRRRDMGTPDFVTMTDEEFSAALREEEGTYGDLTDEQLEDISYDEEYEASNT